ncbi:V4R domain-containing protein [Candidatus Magnetominusculus xianensis]|uniref:4-vinyl reductase 4VR n=1 Tax=Candidatus Magnetominusculus xianensis TaxID=1748249 RepID=A0ABR5SGB1_9BACT|nr:V4R domain-containing protein [Candidatus Magnetominusculus xianensis]KWT88544.1 4-vinyl reductase 4VR [Candidatus Magnetominusculus xianensis]MBF0404088.1 4-vinyl reductase [Nitrospirota bacterium]
MFKEVRTQPMFDWSMIGDIKEGRPNLGATMDVGVYRLMQFTLRDILIKKFSPEIADQLYYEAGELAGTEFCKALINKGNSFPEFIKEVQALLSGLKIGILRVEKADMEKSEFTLTVAEDLDCSGLPMSEETICTYDEGFIAGLLHEFTGTRFKVKEVDCWCSGDRVCRFEVKPEASA